MINIKKHTDVVASMEEFTTNYENGIYMTPWIVYVGNNTDGYSVIYSNDENKEHPSATPEFISLLSNRIAALENEKVYCYEEEYDNLVQNGKGWITNMDGTRSEVVFNENHIYNIYEDDGPNVSPEIPEESTPETPAEPSEPETIEPEGLDE